MNRRGFVSMLAGTAGAGLVLWRIPKPVIVLPTWADCKWASVMDSTPRPAHYTLTIPSVYSQGIALENFAVGDIFDPKIATGAMMDSLDAIPARPLVEIRSLAEALEFFGPE